MAQYFLKTSVNFAVRKSFCCVRTRSNSDLNLSENVGQPAERRKFLQPFGNVRRVFREREKKEREKVNERSGGEDKKEGTRVPLFRAFQRDRL